MVREHCSASLEAEQTQNPVSFTPLSIADVELSGRWDNDVVLELYKDGELADVVIESRDFGAGGRWIAKEVHSFVLALASPVFRRMINWERTRTISSEGKSAKKNPSQLVSQLVPHCEGLSAVLKVLEFSEEDCRVVSALCDFIYTGRTTVSGGPQQLVALCKLADQLDVQRLRTAVVAAARQALTVSTCALMLQCCRHAGVPELEEACLQFALKHFEEVSQTEAFLALDAAFLAHMLADDRLQATTEEVVYEALVLWLTGGRPGRRLSALSQLEPAVAAEEPGAAHSVHHESAAEQEEVGQLLDCVRFGLLQNDYLTERVMGDAERLQCAVLRDKAEQALLMSTDARDAISWRSGSGPDTASILHFSVRHVSRDHAGSVEALAQYGSVIISGSRDGSIRMVDSVAGASLGALVRAPRTGEGGGGVEVELGSVYALLVRGDTLFCGSQLRGAGPLNAFDLRRREHRAQLRGHGEAVMSLEARADSLFSGSWDTTIREWSLQHMHCLRVIQHANSKPVARMVCCKDTLVVSSGTMGATQIHAVHHHGPTPVSASALPPDMVCHAASSAVGIGPGPGADSSSGIFRPSARFYTGHKDGYIRVWETDTWQCVAALPAHKDCVTALAAWGAWLVSGSVDSTVRLWDLSSANLTGVDEEGGLAGMGCSALCVKVIAVQSEVASLVVGDGQIVIGCKDRSIRVIGPSW